MSETLQELADHIELKADGAVLSSDIAFDELTLTVDPAKIVDLVELLKKDATCRFTTLVDITGVDYPSRRARFEVVYHFLSMYRNHRIRLKAAVGEEDTIASIIEVYPAAGWFEREVFDMFGVIFSGHPDLRRILTDYGFRGFSPWEGAKYILPGDEKEA